MAGKIATASWMVAPSGKACCSGTVTTPQITSSASTTPSGKSNGQVAGCHWRAVMVGVG
ncbi:MAG: hypothetical protein IPL78_15980 [Chloroflexi bacterium]|nr:hypothetical protein [Chloroflexota bacterium]